MLKRLVLAFAGATLLLAGAVRAAETSLVLLTENFPPYNMAKNGKNFAQDENSMALPWTSSERFSSAPTSPIA
jgi:polar amino acid transport system substrate-binding protein